jgi:hypothetical protein
MLKRALREAKWRYADNLGPWARYRWSREKARGEAARVLRDLNRDGVAISSVSALLAETPAWRDLRQAVECTERERAAEMAEARRVAGEPGAKKSFLFDLLEERPPADPENPYVRFALQKPILQVVNGYFGFCARLHYYNVWHSFATDAPPQRSQLWHRDQEDYCVVKVFAYLWDVDEGSGPFTYAPGTHPKGPVRGEPEWFREAGHGNRRSTDESMARVVAHDRWVTAVGPAGTILFADTRGYHKGGYARTRDRLIYTCMFTSLAARSTREVRAVESRAPWLDREQAFALYAGGP